jgi:hypothetical protein
MSDGLGSPALGIDVESEMSSGSKTVRRRRAASALADGEVDAAAAAEACGANPMSSCAAPGTPGT